jgi:predicted Zn-dependent protease
MKMISRFAQKPFHYRVYIAHSLIPNACALPGGIVVINKGLINLMSSEAELAAVLAHEMGHVELSHCFNAVKYRVASEKINIQEIGMLADFANHVLIDHSFSKTEEVEADEYAYKLLLLTTYDPYAMSSVFRRIYTYNKKDDAHLNAKRADIVRDYCASHPHMLLRIEKYSQKARQWRKKHPNEKRYLGIESLARRRCLFRSAK